jgi:hypothetical protein
MDKDMKDTLYRKAKLAQWNLDRNSMTAAPANGHEHPEFRVPIKPMLGCRHSTSRKPGNLTYFMAFGGNMDLSWVTAQA